MNLTPEQQELGRRNFLRVLAGTPALAAMGAAAALKGPVRGGPVKRRRSSAWAARAATRSLKNVDPAFADVRAICDINPSHLAKADEILAAAKRPPAKHYDDWKEMLQKEDLEARGPGPAALAPRRDDGRLPGGGQARPLREDDGLGPRGLPARCRRRRGRPAASSRSATSASTTPSTRPPTRGSSRPACSATSTTPASSGTATATGAATKSRPRPTTIPRAGAIRPGSTW